MSVPPSTIGFQRPRRYDGPEFFLGGGFVAGLVVFLIWVAMLPDDGKHSLLARGVDGAADNSLATPGEGVLSGITGPAGRAASATIVSGDDHADVFQEQAQEGDDALMSEADIEDGYQGRERDGMEFGDQFGAPPRMDDGAALADSLLDSPSPMDGMAPGSAPGAPLLPYYVEVEVAPGQVQVLLLNAESPEHARAILRDFRGDPRVLRGPMLDPVE